MVDEDRIGHVGVVYLVCESELVELVCHISAYTLLHSRLG